MPVKNKAVDAYIAKSAPFAQPVLKHLRSLVHEVCPDTEEKIKWGFPHFDYLGEMLCSMAAFKQHCAFGFWKAPLMKEVSLMDNARQQTAMGHLGKIGSLKDLPADRKLKSWIREAMKLNETGQKAVRPKPAPVKEIPVPEDVQAALNKNKKALTQFEKFPPSHRKEYLQWIMEAKTAATRERRLLQMLEWVSEGKNRNWKYQR